MLVVPKITVVVSGMTAVVALCIFLAFHHGAVAQEKINEAIRQWDEWTPENIAAHPEEYLSFCEDKCKKALTDLDAREIAGNQLEANLTTKLNESINATDIGTVTLGSLKEAYKKAEQHNEWPATWEEKSHDKPWFQSAIGQLFAEVSAERDLQAELKDGLARVHALQQQLPAARSLARQQLARIGTNREILKVNKLTQEMKQQMADIGAAVKGLLSDSQRENDLPNLKSLTARTATVDKGNFEKAMAEK